MPSLNRGVAGTGLIASAVLAAAGAAAPASGSDALIASGLEEHNGAVYAVEKRIENGAEVVRYFDGSAWIVEAEFRALIAGQAPKVLGPAVESALAQAGADELVDLVVILREQPLAPIGREEWAAAKAGPGGIDDLSAQIRAIMEPNLPLAGAGSLRPGDEGLMVGVAPDAAAIAARRALAEQLDEKVRRARVRIFERAGAAGAPARDALEAQVVALGGEVTMRTEAVNALGVRIPAGRVAALAADPRVARIDVDHPGAPELDNHQHSLGLVNGFWANGIDGGVQDCGVLDTGVQQNHPALNSHAFMSNMGANDTSTHGTGMAGILASTSTQFPGMAFGLDTIVVAQAGSISTSMPGMNYIAGTGEPENVNYSFGNGTANSQDYSATDQFFDGVIDTFGFMVSKSTGNGGYSSCCPTITHPAPAYNLMASANMDDFNSVTRADDRITSSSSTGPTVAGRKKPDITAPGNNSMSCHPGGGFANIGGTSSASPHTGGGIVLLFDMGVPSAMAAKAVLLNTTDAITDNGTSSTADDVFVNGSLWNRRYGWGYLNLGSAYAHGLDVFQDSVPDAPESADFRLYKGQMFEFEKATLTWQRHVAYNGAAFPTQVEGLSDLDLTMWRESNGATIAASQSRIDNVEQLHAPEDAVVVLKVDVFGSFDPDIDLEEYALATQENFIAADPPAFDAAFTHQATATPEEEFTVEVEVENTGDARAHGVAVNLSGVTIVSGANPQNVGGIDAGGGGVASWTVRAPMSQGPVPISVSISSNSYGESFSGAGASQFTVVPGGCSGDVDGDGDTDTTDLNILLSAFGCAGADCEGDLDGDGDTDTTDLNILLSGFGCEAP